MELKYVRMYLPPPPQGWLRWEFLTPKWLLAGIPSGGVEPVGARGAKPLGLRGGLGGLRKFLMVYGAKIASFYAAAASAPAASSSGRSGCSRAHSTAIKPILEHDDAANVRCDIMRVVICQWCERNLELFNFRSHCKQQVRYVVYLDRHL